ncbi:CIR N-terminal domain-containing protein [Chloropicon primus]|uniref:CBF1-interacting co-repressor CIR N-terminal domain-containing protein n=1 Tax=Chloropicon primus TaxID=1764295 RepID=A0A5B8MYL3_9CHLO|nr:hypothetical protein A3770_14p72530 [Chloropicon primus]UPR03941.1 CIR N-terminal domain-containing protein [Chloropicon primus]|eukprot:QDZ24735.1 hypothetical protein A3770_14p72530 [Chloropicon primus]
MGGHGGLNILPHKSWNVYNRENRARVKRDEEAAGRAEEEKKRKRQEGDSEYRFERLRARRRGEGGGEDRGANRHVNLFEKEEAAAERGGHRRRDKPEPAQTHLDENFRLGGRRRDAPWYAKASGDRKPCRSARPAQACWDDPLKTLKAGKKKQREEEKRARGAESEGDTHDGVRASTLGTESGRKGERRRRRKHRRHRSS